MFLSYARLFRKWFAHQLGVDEERKGEIYFELSRSVSLLDAIYWLQIIFAAGIATLGLVLNSPAVIIGAMLISPLMGPILSGGLALAAADFVLGFRVLVNLFLSCLVALIVAALLVSLLPFKEITHEISARTEPTTLDMVIALFSGAIGSIVTCRREKSVVTSIPGVAIAVALMPPLCVVGYGLGSAANIRDGLQIARGGGLLFLTNLVAITFTAMIVFLALHIDTPTVKERISEWQKTDGECRRIRSGFDKLPIARSSQTIGRLPTRFLMIGIPLLVLLLPLSQSFKRLNEEIKQQQTENRVRQVATDVWRKDFVSFPDGKPRSYVNQLSVAVKNEEVGLSLRVFSIKPYSPNERAEYVKLVASQLNRKPESVKLEFIDVPTSSADVAQAQEQPQQEQPVLKSLADIHADFSARSAEALSQLELPPPAKLLDYRLVTTSAEPLKVELTYLSERDIETDANTLLEREVRGLLNYPTAITTLTRVNATPPVLTFGRNRVVLSPAEESQLDQIGTQLQKEPKLSISISAGAQAREREGVAEQRANAVKEYIVNKFNIAAERLLIESTIETEPTVTMKLFISTSKA